MLNLFPKKSVSVKNWHSKAMLIDPRKTRLTIINIQTLERQEKLESNVS